ncbi:glycosyltransferase [Acinetobacter sp. LF10]|uniref:glycosyltransferase n=1 Tax=Acinetobacter sp. LF10 TaxID=3403576 RepID=UPI003B2230BC
MNDNLILINASNLHNGGGVQVAISFLFELSKFNKEFKNIHIWVSSEVHQGLIYLQVDINIFGDYVVANTYGIRSYFSDLNSKIANYKLVFTVFGPNYFRCQAKKEIVGFAQSWITNFDNPISRKMPFFSRNILKIKFYLQWLFFLRADHYIVELEHVKRSLNKYKGINNNKISVVYNSISSLYLDKNKWSSIFIPRESNNSEILLGIVTRDYPHKNLDILPYVAKLLDKKYNLRVRFYVTLNESEWSVKNSFFKQYVSTVGSLTPDQCPSFYQQMDGVIFPSLLECFSVTPLEAMVMGKPLFASDRSFIRDICSDYAIYFNPEDYHDIAFKIFDYFSDYSKNIFNLDEAKIHALSFSSAADRASKYLKIIQQNIEV